jgi:D-alanyl-D-alanine carboxypeptidase/D-alanyl-D-alanine-endopeptidase (penicillin-binding protein 4)
MSNVQEQVKQEIHDCLVDELWRDPRLGVPQIQVRDAETGEVLFDRDGDTPVRTASVLKILTSAAAFGVLGPDYRIPTIVVRGAKPGEIVLVGRGDVTLTRVPTGQESFYTGAPHLDELAARVRRAWEADPQTAGTPITSLVLDASYYGEPAWLPSWEEIERTEDGDMEPMTAIQVDADRDDPLEAYCERSIDPVGRAGAWFAEALGGDIAVSLGVAPADAAELARVESQPVEEIITQGLRTSDNSVMEMLARHVAIVSGFGNTFDSASAAVLAALDRYGVPTTGLHFADGSGLSHDNRVSPSYLTRFLVKVLNRENGLGLLYDRLPASGTDGLSNLGADRFAGENSIVGGAVHAKTGFIYTAYTLAGIVHANDGHALTFAVFALGDDIESGAREAIDNLVTAFYKCGQLLATHS